MSSSLVSSLCCSSSSCRSLESLPLTAAAPTRNLCFLWANLLGPGAPPAELNLKLRVEAGAPCLDGGGRGGIDRPLELDIDMELGGVL
jgi:hypothetical protein